MGITKRLDKIERELGLGESTYKFLLIPTVLRLSDCGQSLPIYSNSSGNIYSPIVYMVNAFGKLLNRCPANTPEVIKAGESRDLIFLGTICLKIDSEKIWIEEVENMKGELDLYIEEKNKWLNKMQLQK